MRSSKINRHNAQVIARLVQLLAPGEPALEASARADVERDVIGFVVSQVRAMPSFLRLPYRLALLGFDWLPVLRYGKAFVTLPDAAAARYLTLWSERGPRVMRDFVKLIRSCALLAYFDHPLVRAALDAAPRHSGLQRAIGNGMGG